MPPRRDTLQPSLFEALSSEGTGWRATSWRAETPSGMRGVLYWLPVLLPLAIFAQFALLGMRPALDESERLARSEARLVASFEEQLARSQRIDSMLRAQRDPIYLERERRMVLAADSSLLGR